jgi:hypothetical protein
MNVQGHIITVSHVNDHDYISLTDIVKDEEGSDHIRNWMRNRNTIEYLGLWETINNPDFKGVEFDTFRKQAGLNNFNLTPRKWIDATGAIGIISTSGKNGGTYAHKDIAFEFCSWFSPMFKLYLIKEFQRLKEVESNQYNLEWNFKRVLSKANYSIHTSAIKEHIIPKANVEKDKEWIIYANEADLLNVALFGITAKVWRDNNPQLALQGNNIRDIASINQLAVLSNLESLNSLLIKNGVDKKTRFEQMKMISQQQLKALEGVDFIKSYNRLSDTTYQDAQDQKRIADEKKEGGMTFGDAIGKIANAKKPKNDS